MEVDAVFALGITDARSAGAILGAVEHDKFSAIQNDAGVEGSGGFPAAPLWGKNRGFRNAMPVAERRSRLSTETRDQDTCAEGGAQSPRYGFHVDIVVKTRSQRAGRLCLKKTMPHRCGLCGNERITTSSGPETWARFR